MLFEYISSVIEFEINCFEDRTKQTTDAGLKEKFPYRKILIVSSGAYILCEFWKKKEYINARGVQKFRYLAKSVHLKISSHLKANYLEETER